MNDFEQAVTRMNGFIDGLVRTKIAFLYFVVDRNTQDLIPTVKTNAKKLTFQQNDFYLIPGVGTKGYFYTYQESSIKYLVNAAQSSVVSYSEIDYAPFGGGYSEANHGNHLTVGLMLGHSKTSNIPVLDTHFTIYYNNPNSTGIQGDDDTKCRVLLTPSLNDDTSCINYRTGKEISGDTLSLVYKDVTKLIPLILYYKDIYLGLSSGGKKQSKEYATICNRKYVIHEGKRGGRFVYRNSKKIYIQKGGNVKEYNNIRFSQEVVDFVQTLIMQPVANADSKLIRVTLIYDEECETSPTGNENIVMMFDFEWQEDLYEYRRVYYYNTLQVLMAYYASTIPEHQRTEDEQNAYEDVQTFGTKVQQDAISIKVY